MSDRVTVQRNIRRSATTSLLDKGINQVPQYELVRKERCVLFSANPNLRQSFRRVPAKRYKRYHRL